jgi:hypothetical protein
LICHIDHSFAFGGCVNVPSMLRFLVASPPVRDLLLCAKDLFVAASSEVHRQSHHANGSYSMC